MTFLVSSYNQNELPVHDIGLVEGTFDIYLFFLADTNTVTDFFFFILYFVFCIRNNISAQFNFNKHCTSTATVLHVICFTCQLWHLRFKQNPKSKDDY